MTEKLCERCHLPRPVEEFARQKTICRACCKEQARILDHGVSEEEYTSLWKAQNGKCAICRLDLKGLLAERTEDRAHVDRCHGYKQHRRSKNPRARGLLCKKCLAGLDAFHEDPEILLRAIQYLETQKASHKFCDHCQMCHQKRMKNVASFVNNVL